LDRIKPFPQNVVVVAHGGILRALRNSYESLRWPGAPWDPVPNGCVWRLPLKAADAPDPLLQPKEPQYASNTATTS
jgi:broad specificity phosphatase PhoE